jgi:hypothetical protein
MVSMGFAGSGLTVTLTEVLFEHPLTFMHSNKKLPSIFATMLLPFPTSVPFLYQLNAAAGSGCTTTVFKNAESPAQNILVPTAYVITGINGEALIVTGLEAYVSQPLMSLAVRMTVKICAALNW